MKKHILAMVLAIVITIGGVPTSVLSAAADKTEALFYVTQSDDEAARRGLYVPGALFMWDAFDLTAGEVPAGLVNRIDGKTVSCGSAGVRAGDGYLLIQGTLNLSQYVPYHTVDSLSVLDDMTFEMALAQNRDVAVSDMPGEAATYLNVQTGKTATIDPNSGKGTQQVGIFQSVSMQTMNMADQMSYGDKVNSRPIDASFGFISGVSKTYTGYATCAKRLATDIAWQPIRFLGNRVGVPYFIAYSMDYTVAEGATAGTARARLMRDGQLARKDGAATGETDFEFTAYEACSAISPTVKFGHAAGFEYYAIRIYARALSEAELQQNHFADLANFAKIDMAGYELLDDCMREELYAKYRTVQFTDESLHADRVRLKEAIEADIQTYAALIAAAAKVVSFDGFQIRTAGYAGLRARFTLQAEIGSAVDGYTVKEIGAIVGVAGSDTAYSADGQEMDKLTVSKGTDGQYGADRAGTLSCAVEPVNIFTDEDTGHRHFVYTVTFDSEERAEPYGKSEYQTELIYRAYVILSDAAGHEHAVYIDAVGGTFPDGRVSMLALTEVLDAEGQLYETSRIVLAACKE